MRDLESRLAPYRESVRLVTRLMVAIPGGYSLTAAAVAALAGLLPLLGSTRSDSVVLSAMFGFVLYLVLLLWAFAERRLTRLCSVVIGGTVVCGAMVWLMPVGA